MKVASCRILNPSWPHSMPEEVDPDSEHVPQHVIGSPFQRGIGVALIMKPNRRKHAEMHTTIGPCAVTDDEDIANKFLTRRHAEGVRTFCSIAR